MILRCPLHRFVITLVVKISKIGQAVHMSQGGPHTLKAQCPSLRTEEVIHAPIRGMFLLPDSRARIKNQTRRPLLRFSPSTKDRSRSLPRRQRRVESRSLIRTGLSRDRFVGFFFFFFWDRKKLKTIMDRVVDLLVFFRGKRGFLGQEFWLSNGFYLLFVLLLMFL